MILLRIARSRRCGSSDSKLGMIGRVVSVMAAAVADVRPGEHALRQALKLVQANRSILARDDVEASRRWVSDRVVRSAARCCSIKLDDAGHRASGL